MIISIAIAKGGVGKTTTALNIAAALSQLGQFVLVVDLDQQNHLSRLLEFENDGKPREVIFLLDEFGNIVPIPDMSKILSVCLGRNIKFNLVVQAYSQIYKLYGTEDAKTVIANCGNQVYLLTIELETAEKFSKMIGNETISITSRSGNPMSLKKRLNEHVDQKPLLNPNELMELLPGETVVCRITKRTDLKGNKITPNPIFNRKETIMKYRYEYLVDSFDNNKSLSNLDLEGVCKHKNLWLENYIYRPFEISNNINEFKEEITLKDLCSSNEIITLLKNKSQLEKEEIKNMTITQLDIMLNNLFDLKNLSGEEYEYILDLVNGCDAK